MHTYWKQSYTLYIGGKTGTYSDGDVEYDPPKWRLVVEAGPTITIVRAHLFVPAAVGNPV